MEVVRLSSLHLMKNHPRTTIEKSHLRKPICVNFPHNPARSKTVYYKLCTAISRGSATEPSSPPLTELETDTGEERFDWFAQWYPIMPVCDLDKRIPHAKKVMGIDVVVWWDRNENDWKVFDDLCPHRLAPLSEGRIDQWGRLQCVYHGWCFNGSGDCKFIPQAPPDGPPVHTSKKACVSVYPSIVQNNVVWFWPNTNPEYKDMHLTKKPPYISELDDPLYTKLMGNRDFPYGYEFLIENLMDPAHVPYAHFQIMKVPQSKNIKADREGGEPIEITVKNLSINGFDGEQPGSDSKFIPPCVFYTWFTIKPDVKKTVRKGNESVLSSGKNTESSDNVLQKKALLIFICIPVSPGKSRLIWSFPRNFGQWIDRVIPRWIFHLSANLILDSDLYLLHLEEKKIADLGVTNWQKVCYMPTKSDGKVVAFRRWLNKYSSGEVGWRGKFRWSPLPPSPPREQLMDRWELDRTGIELIEPSVPVLLFLLKGIAYIFPNISNRFRYWSHVVNCKSCNSAHKALKLLEITLQVVSVASLGLLAASNGKQGWLSPGGSAGAAVVALALLCFGASRWLSHFVYKNFHFHDYDHSLL